MLVKRDQSSGLEHQLLYLASGDVFLRSFEDLGPYLASGDVFSRSFEEMFPLDLGLICPFFEDLAPGSLEMYSLDRLRRCILQIV